MDTEYRRNNTPRPDDEQHVLFRLLFARLNARHAYKIKKKVRNILPFLDSSPIFLEQPTNASFSQEL